MLRYLSPVLSSLAFLSIASAFPSPPVPYAPARQGTALRPIAIADWEKASGLHRRDESQDFSDLSLQTQSQLIYGSHGDNGQLLLANMTLYAPDGLEMIMMERFEGLTSAVDCRGDDGTMSLTFSSADAYNAALEQWAHINDSEEGRFLLIANHDGCGPDDERQPYIISKITEDQSTYTTYLTAETAAWSDVAGTYDLDFGQITPYQQTGVQERGLGKCLFTGSCDESKSVTFDVAAGTKGKVSNIYSDSRFKLDCINCFTTGSFQLAGHISTHHWSLSTLTLTATPQDFTAALELQASVTATTEPAKLQYEKELLSFPIPGAGISVTGIFSIGATLSYNVGFSSTIQGKATVDFGLSSSIPNGAQLTADIKNPGSSSATGFSGGSLTPLFDVKDLSASITLAAYSKPKLAFGIELVKIGTAEVDISVKLPEVDVTLSAAYNEAGVCSGSPSTTGVSIKSNFQIGVDLGITAELGSSAAPSWSKNLFSLTKPIASKCFPLNIPGLQPSQTALPSTASTLSISTLSNPATRIYSPSGAPTLAPIVNGSSYIIAPSGVSKPYSASGRTGAPSFTGTGYYPYSSGVIGSGVAASTGTGKATVPRATGTGYYPYSSGVIASGVAASTGTRKVNAPSFTGSGYLPYSSSIIHSGAPESSGTGTVMYSSKMSAAPYPISSSKTSSPYYSMTTGVGATGVSSRSVRASGTFRA